MCPCGPTTDRRRRSLATTVCSSGLFVQTNAPASFQRALDVILSGFQWQMCLVYLDDVFVFVKTAEDHVHHLDRVLSRLRMAGVTLTI